MEAEYVAAREAAKEAVWLRQFLIDLDMVPNAISRSLSTVTTMEQWLIRENQEFIREENTLKGSIIF